jgi:hypothetical protein
MGSFAAFESGLSGTGSPLSCVLLLQAFRRQVSARKDHQSRRLAGCYKVTLGSVTRRATAS